MEKHHILTELQEHLPFSIFFTGAGIILAASLTYIGILTGAYLPQHTEHLHDAEESGHVHSAACAHGQSAHEHELDVHVDEHADHADHADRPEDHAEEHAEEHAEHAEHEQPATAHAQTELREDRLQAASGMMFHIFHPVHLLLSAMATTAMFFRHERRLWKGLVVGFVGSVGVCGLSDVFMPFLAGRWLAVENMHFHWCLIRHPQMVLPFVGLGIISGLLAALAVHRSTVLSHSAHVLISSAASLFYLISFGVGDWFSEEKLPIVFAVVVLCVTIPCCLSDVLFPLLIANSDGEVPECCTHHAH